MQIRNRRALPISHMKFGKRLLDAAVPEWRSWYIDYKALKKQIKKITESRYDKNDVDEYVKGEEYFKVMIMVQMAKASEFYEKMERYFQQAVSNLNENTCNGRGVDDIEILRTNNQVDHLRRFVVLNYIAVLKIMKKHDKMTGYNLRTEYLPKLLQSSFCLSKGLGQLLDDLDILLDTVRCKSTDASSPIPSDRVPRGGSSNSCPICLSSLVNPVELSCKHVFCFSCLSKAANAKINTCPVCRKFQTLDPLEYEIEKILGDTLIPPPLEGDSSVDAHSEAKLAHSMEYFSARFADLPPNPHCLIVGNRGCHIGCGNSIGSLEAALACGVDMIKFEVQVCGSGELIVFHELILESGLTINNTTLEKVREELPNIITLDDALDCINQRAIAYIDIKGDGAVPALASTIATRLVEGDWRGEKFIVGSCNQYDIVNLRKLLPKGKGSPFDSLLTAVRCGGVPLGLAQSFVTLGVNYIEINYEEVRADFVIDAHKRGIRVLVGVVDDDTNFLHLQKLKVEGIITNFPEELLAIQAEKVNNIESLSNGGGSRIHKASPGIKRFTTKDALSSLISENKDRLEELMNGAHHADAATKDRRRVMQAEGWGEENNYFISETMQNVMYYICIAVVIAYVYRTLETSSLESS